MSAASTRIRPSCSHSVLSALRRSRRIAIAVPVAIAVAMAMPMTVMPVSPVRDVVDRGLHRIPEQRDVDAVGERRGECDDADERERDAVLRQILTVIVASHAHVVARYHNRRCAC